MKDLFAKPQAPSRLLDQGLGSQADTQDGEVWGGFFDDLKETTRLGGPSRPWGQDQDSWAGFVDLGGFGSVAPGGPCHHAETPEGLLQVEHEAVAVVE